MSQRLSVESPNQSASTQLKPALQAVLSSLDVNLEEELIQYRRHRQKAQQWVAPSSRLSSNRGERVLEPSLLVEEESLPVSSPDRKPEIPHLEPLSPSSPLTIASKADAAFGTKGAVQGASATPQTAPDNYLESSEILLKSLDEPVPEATPETDRSLTQSLFTPLGVSSMLLFLMSCATLGYVVLHPSSLETLSFNRWFKQTAPASTASPDAIAVANETSNPAALPKAPNLTSKEFVDLDLSTLSNVKPSPSALPSPSAKPSLPPTPKALTPVVPRPLPVEPDRTDRQTDAGLNNLSKALLPQPSPTVVAPLPTAIPSPATPGARPALSTATPSTPVPSPKTTSVSPGVPIKSPDGFYYVVLDYSGEASLERARQAVPDAYVRDFPNGVKIQMGALDDARSAQRLVQELQEKGVSAKYHQP